MTNAIAPNLISRFMKASGSAFIQMVSFQGTTFLVNIVLAHTLGTGEYGLFSAGLQTLNAAGQIGQLSTASVGSRYLGQWYDQNRAQALTIWEYCRRIGLISSFLVSSVLVLAAPLLAHYLFRQPELENPLRLAGVATFFFSASQQSIQALAAVEAVRTISIVSVLSGLIYTISCIVGGKFGGYIGGMIGVLVSYIGLWGILQLVEKNKLRSTKTDTPLFQSEIIAVRKQIIPASIAGFCLLPSTWLLMTSVTHYAGASETGIYSAATQLRLLLMICPQMLNAAGLIMVNRMALTKNNKHADTIATFTLIGSAIICMLLGYLSSSFVPVLFGAKYIAAIPVFRALLPSIVLESSILYARQRLQARASFWEWLLCVVLPWQIGTIVTSLFFVPKWGALGAAISYSSGLSLGLIGFFILSLYLRSTSERTKNVSSVD